MSQIIAIDPGTEQSAVVWWNGISIGYCDILSNETLRDSLGSGGLFGKGALIIEWIESYGMPVGKEVFETCRWIGRFQEAFESNGFGGVHYVPRRTVKLHLCNSAKAKDSNIRQALIDRFGAPGTKKAPGVTYGLKADMWAAFALAVTWWDQHNGMKG